MRQKEIHPDDNLELDLGLDSMERVELLTDLAHRLGAEVEDSAASEVYTVRELVDVVRRNMGKNVTPGSGWHTVFEGETTDPEVLAITHERPVVGFLWWLCGKGVKWASHVLFKLRVEGMENLPDGPSMICPNHSSYLDAPILTAALPWKAFHNVFYVGTSEIFGEGRCGNLRSSCTSSQSIRIRTLCRPCVPEPTACAPEKSSSCIPRASAPLKGRRKNSKKVRRFFPASQRSHRPCGRVRFP